MSASAGPAQPSAVLAESAKPSLLHHALTPCTPAHKWCCEHPPLVIHAERCMPDIIGGCVAHLILHQSAEEAEQLVLDHQTALGQLLLLCIGLLKAETCGNRNSRQQLQQVSDAEVLPRCRDAYQPFPDPRLVQPASSLAGFADRPASVCALQKCGGLLQDTAPKIARCQ